MKKIEKLVRKNILKLTPYSSARSEFKGRKGIFLDANENPFGKLNRYPDPLQTALKKQLGSLKKINPANIFIGNGSDEVIDLAIRIFCEPGKDSIIILPPTYGMYEVCADLNNVRCIKIPLNENFQPDVASILKVKNAKILFLCSPNNPTGNSLESLEKLVKSFDGIVFIDEAYIDFSKQPSFLEKLKKYENVIISQTLSKAVGLASARVGIAYASEDIISLYNKVKPPYNVSELNQMAALNALRNLSQKSRSVNVLLKEKEKMIQNLNKISTILKIYPSDANFLLVKCKNADNLYKFLTKNGIIVRNRSSVISSSLRITIGTPAENKKLIDTLKKFEV